uniref:Glycosylphosphatidylinositol anchor attachment 1 protein n=1 Tax=Phallusia mammillata TaxID=59560 RepID=A0A6F9DDC2_9ASCI|nr:glycosylphosphatidylinositol anchor attachment 1 protein [Phallusia mammillata]
MSGLKKLLPRVNKICILLYFGGIVGFLLLSHEGIRENCYFSENALLPGLVDSKFSASDDQIHNINLDILDPNSEVTDELEKFMLRVGLEVYRQKFTFQEKFVGNARIQNGTNIYGIVRAPRSASTECIVINIPILNNKHNFGMGIVLALAKEMRKQFYWAKDVIFLFTEHGSFGARAWLNAYHGIVSYPVSANQLPARAGSIQSAFTVHMEEDAVSFINLLVEGYNGQLPNLDLFNVAVRLIKIHGMAVSVNYEFVPRQSSAMDDIKSHLGATLKMMKKQVTGTSSGNHGEFIRHGIEAITLQTVYNPQWGNAGFVRLGRVIEGISRSLNNLLERFHQSFFFYILPSTDNYISIGMYMPPLGLMLAAAAIKALSLILEANYVNSEETDKNKETKKDSDTKESVEDIDDILKDMGSDYASKENDIKNSEAPPLQQILITMVTSHMMGFLVFYAPVFTETWSQMFNCPQDISITLLLVTVHIAGMFIITSYRLTLEGGKSLYVVSLLHQGILFGVVAIINFSLGMFLAVCYVLPTILLQPGYMKFNLLRKFVAFLVSPLSIAALICLYTCNGNPATVISEFVNFHVTVYEQSQTQQSWLFDFIALLLYPLWLQFWAITSSEGKILT